MMVARGRVALVATLAGAAALATYALFGVRVSADFAAFLPQGSDPWQRVLVSQVRDGVTGRLLFIELSGSDPAVLAAQSKSLAKQIGADPAYRYVANGDAGFGRAELDVIERNRYVLSDRVDAALFETGALRKALEARLEDLSGSAGFVGKQTLAFDPTGETAKLLQRFTPVSSPQRVQGVWFDATRTRALLLAESRAAGADLDGQVLAIDALERAFAGIAAGTSTRIRYSGAGAMAARSRALIARQATVITLASTASIVAILAWTYRSFSAVALCAVPALLGWLAGVAAVDVAFGGVHGITLAFGATLLGEAVDYPSLLLTQAVRGESLAATRRRIGPWLRLAVLTTACGSVALLLSGFPGLMQLGLFTAVGIVTAGLVTWYGLPQWLSPAWTTQLPQHAAASGMRWRVRRPVAMSIVAVVSGVALASAWGLPVWNDDPAALNPLPASLAAVDRDLRGELGAADARQLVFIRGASLQQVLVRSERARAALDRAHVAGALDGFDVPSDYLPSEGVQQQRRAALPAPAELHERLQVAAAGLPFRSDAFAPFERDVDAARRMPPMTIATYDGTALGLKLRGMLASDDDGWHAIAPLRGIRDSAAIDSAVASLDDPSIRVLDLRTEAATLLAAYRRQALVSCAAGLLLIIATLAVGLKSIARAVRVVVPVMLAVFTSGCVLVALRQPLGIVHVVALLLIVGIGVNYAMFVLRANDLPDERRRTARTLLVVSSTTLCAFAGLALSSIPVLHAIGATVCVGIVASLAFSVLLLAPAAALPRSAG